MPACLTTSTHAKAHSSAPAAMPQDEFALPAGRPPSQFVHAWRSFLSRYAPTLIPRWRHSTHSAYSTARLCPQFVFRKIGGESYNPSGAVRYLPNCHEDVLSRSDFGLRNDNSQYINPLTKLTDFFSCFYSEENTMTFAFADPTEPKTT
jgi:hypothetical protein